jgi:HK97 family phage prohead protease
MSDRMERLLGAPERRNLAVSDFEVRAEGDEMVLEGYASVLDKPYAIFGGAKEGGWDEIVDRRAFDATLAAKPDVHLLINHEGLPLARTKSGTMDLSTDKTGLRVVARLDPADADVQRIATKMRRRDIDEMSFAFRTIRHEVDEEKSTRRLTEVSIHKGDVSVVNFGANPATSVKLRAATDAIALLRDIEPEAAMAELRGIENPLDALTEARRTLDGLIRNMTPAASRRLSVAEAEALVTL